MACEDQINTEDLINAKTDAVTLGEVATSRAGAVEGGVSITTSTNRFGETTDTIQGRLNKMGVLYDNPIRDWSASLLVSDLRAHRFPATTGDIYIPTKPLPFTTGGTFNTDDWELFQGAFDINRVITFDTLSDASTESDGTRMFEGAAINIKERTTGNNGGAMWDVVLTLTPNGIDIIQCTGVPSLALVLSAGDITILTLGGLTTSPDNLSVFLRGQELTDSLYVDDGDFTVSDIAQLTGKYHGPGLINSIPVANTSQGTSVTIYGFDAGKNFVGDFSTADNTLIGRGCGREMTTGTKNTGLGQGVFSGDTNVTAGPTPMTGNDNVGVGFHTLKKMSSGTFNVAMGTDAGNEITTGGSNTTLGGSAGQQVTIGFDNTLIGRSAGLRMGQDQSSLDPDTFIDLNTTGNVAVGRDALRNGYDCGQNTVVGYQAMRGTKDEADFTGNITGDFNVVLGYRAMYTQPEGATGNVVIGTEALRDAIDNRYNVIIGQGTCRDTTLGDNAVILGSQTMRGNPDITNAFAVANQRSLPFLEGIMGPVSDAGNFLRVDGNLSAGVGSQRTCGTSTRPWTTIFADNTVIQTSDSRYKTTPEEIPDAMFIAWGNARKKVSMWKWLAKGDDARYHFGPIAQEVFAEFEKQGIDPFDYGFACSDKVFKPVTYYDDDGEVSYIKDEPVINPKTGEQEVRYALRQGELLMLEIAYNVWKESN